MSETTEVTVIVATCPTAEFTEAITAPIPGDQRNQRLQKLDTDYAGGTKAYFSGLYAAQLNYVHPTVVMDFLESLDWSDYSAAVVFDYEHADAVEVFRLPREDPS